MKFPLIGNDGVKKSLIKSINENRLPHAIIIEGENLSGKSTLAKFIAMSVMCSNEEKPCLQCKNCHLVDISTHPDLFIVAPEEKKKNISVEQIRKMKLEAYIRPQMCDRKVFIIDSAHTLNSQSQNALLKVLEEPPGDTTFILNVLSRSSLLETIISRCVIYSINNPQTSEAVKFLCEKEGLKEDEAMALIKSSQSSIGRALENMKGRRKTDISALAQDYFEMCDKNDIYSLINHTVSLEKDRVKAKQFFSHLSFLILGAIKDSAVNGRNTDRYFYLYEVVKEALELLESNINLPLLFCFTAQKFKN